MIIYTCPECGHDLLTSELTCIPPIHRYECPKCGWKHEEREEVTRVSFGEPIIQTTPAVINTESYRNDPCKHCSNNPANGGSGICNCILGMTRIIC